MGSTDIESFNRDQEPLLRERVDIILFLGFLLVPFFGWLDYLLFPDLFSRFMTYRVIASFSCLLLYVINRRWDFGYKSSYLGICAYYIVGWVIIRMITDTGGYATSYYAGLNLVFLGFCTVLPLNSRVLALHCLMLYGVYLCAVLCFKPLDRLPLFIGNNMFVLSTLMIGLVVSLVNHRLRYKEYRLRSELHRAEQKLKRYSRSLEHSVLESEEKYRLVVDYANDAIFILQDGGIKFPNPKALEIFGYSEEDLSGISFKDIVFGEDRSRVFDQAGQIRIGEVSASIAPFRIISQCGDMLWVDMNSVPITWKGEEATLHFIRDITERKKLETELFQAQKMEAIGTLAGGIAHDFNNLLQVISGYLQIILMNKSPEDPDHHALGQIEKASQRASELTKQLLVYGRKVESELKPIDLNRIILRVSSLLERVIPKMILMDMRLAPDLIKISADPTQLEQIIMNLVVNARDAMPKGGKIGIKTGNFEMDAAFCEKHADVTPGRYALLTISDTGEGMAQEILERIFDPFYTTKEKGKGTGLGLAIVFSIVKSHRGTVLCQSKPRMGTTFEIYLPAAGPEPSHETAPENTVRSLLGNEETILLVDDDRDLIQLTRSMLETHHYKILSARNGEEALETFLLKRDIISLVILDLNMPGMGGAGCLEELLVLDPEVKVIIATGYLDEGQKNDLLKAGASAYVAKPYRFQTMLGEIKRLLG